MKTSWYFHTTLHLKLFPNTLCRTLCMRKIIHINEICSDNLISNKLITSSVRLYVVRNVLVLPSIMLLVLTQ